MSPRKAKFSRTDLHQAVLQIERGNQKATIKGVRNFLGGGSTLIIGEFLKNQKELSETALELAESISNTTLLNTVVQEVDTYDRSSAEEWAKAKLAGYLGDSCPPAETTFREYVTTGLTTLSLIADNAIVEIDYLASDGNELNHELGEEQNDELISQKVLWLKAFSHAAETADRGEMAVEFGEDWIEHNE